MTSPRPTTPMNSCTSGILVRPVLSKSLRYDEKAEARSFTSGAVSREGARGRRNRALRGEMRGGKGKADRASKASTRERFFVRWVVVDTPQDFAYLALAMREVMVEEVGEKMEAVVKAPPALPSSPPV